LRSCDGVPIGDGMVGCRSKTSESVKPCQVSTLLDIKGKPIQNFNDMHGSQYSTVITVVSESCK